MTDATSSTRRSFLKGGAVVAAPLAAAGAAATAARSEQQARLERLKAESDIRALHQAWLRKVNTGDRAEAARLHEAVTQVAVDHEAAPDLIELAADGRSAHGRYHCVVEIETPRPLDCTLAQMAKAQGEGMIRSGERRVLAVRYVRAGDGWAIDRLRLEPT